MRATRRLTTPLALAVALACGAAPAVSSAATYAATKMLSLTGQPIIGEAINDVGQTAGHTGLLSAWSAGGYIKTGTTTMSTFNLAGAHFCTATSINDGGSLAAVCTVGYNDRAIYKPRGGALLDLFAAYPNSFDEAYAINVGNKVVGTHRATANSYAKAFMYDPSTARFSWLGDLGGYQSVAMSINDSDTIVGYSFDVAKVRRAFVHAGGHMTQLPSLGVGFDTAYSVNGLGVIVGRCGTTSTSVTTACQWNNGVTNLGGLGGTGAGADAINDSGTVVGWALDASGVQRAVTFSGGAAHDLNAMLKTAIGSRLTEAIALDSVGTIIAIDNAGYSWQLTPQ
jgi:probable HAF family extracellular repeat protein